MFDNIRFKNQFLILLAFPMLVLLFLLTQKIIEGINIYQNLGSTNKCNSFLAD